MKNGSVPGLIASCAFLLSACASLPPGWKEYREATKCHLQNKNEECDKSYEKAIKKNPKLPGLRSSYASHLFRRGDAAGAEDHFKAEMENHPRSQQAILVVYKGRPDSASLISKTPKEER
jgi:hypothetical protein